jgi:hypothetical protein
MDEPEARVTKLEQDVAGLKAEFWARLAVVKADILVRLAEVEGGLKSEISGIRTEVVQAVGSLRLDMERSNNRLLRWVIVVVLVGQLLPGLLKHVGM